jgi:hypothetical protein
MDLLSDLGKVAIVRAARRQFTREGTTWWSENHTGRCMGAGAANEVACDDGFSTA